MSQDESSSRRPPQDRWLFIGLLALLLWLPLPWGSHSAAAISLAGVATYGLLSVWFALACFGRLRPPGRSGSGALLVPMLLWAGWLGWIALQATPLQPGWLAMLSPQSLQMHEPLATVAPGQRPLYSLSIAPGVTWTKWFESTVYFGLYLLAVLLVRSDRRIRWLLATLLVAGVVQATWGGIMVLSGKEYGWLAKKEFYIDSATGTFVNRNHFAGYLELAAAAGLALVLADLGGDRRGWNWDTFLTRILDFALSAKIRARAALVVIAVGLVLSKSRMGNLAFFAAVSIGGVSYVLLRERQMFVRALVLFASVLAVDVLTISGNIGLEKVIERIETTRVETEGRLKLLAEIGPVAEAYALTGSGLGTFSLAYEPHRSEAVTEYMNHAHNDYVELLVETGVVGMALLGGLLLWHALHALRVVFRRNNRVKVSAAFAVLMAMLALGTHAVAEFVFQIPAITGTFVVLLGTIAACSDRGREGQREARAAQPGAPAAKAGAA